MFATDPDRLGQRIGTATMKQVLDQLRGEGHAVVSAPRDQLLNRVRTALKGDAGVKGVVLLGGYSVVPAYILNTLPAELAGVRVRDRDRLQVWSDDGYGDRHSQFSSGEGVVRASMSSARWQAAKRCGAISRTGGRSVTQRSMASGQRSR